MIAQRRTTQLQTTSLTFDLLRRETLATQDVGKRLGRECKLFEELEACGDLHQDDGAFVVDQAIEQRRLQPVREPEFSHGIGALMPRQGEVQSRALRRAAFPQRWSQGPAVPAR